WLMGEESDARGLFKPYRDCYISRRGVIPRFPFSDGFDAGWSSPVARQAHNLKVVGSNPAPATKSKSRSRKGTAFLLSALSPLAYRFRSERLTEAKPYDLQDQSQCRHRRRLRCIRHRQ